MDPKVNVKLIGISVMGILFVVISMLFLIHKSKYDQCSEVYQIYFNRPITGLKKGDQVVYNGIVAGRVKDMKPDFKHLERVIVTICLEKGFPIKEDAYAIIESKSITGGVIVSVDPGSNKADLLRRQGKTIPVIRSKESRMEELMQNLPKILVSMEQTFQKIADIFSKDTQNDVQKSIKAIGEIMVRVENFLKNNEHGINTWVFENSVKFNQFLEKSSQVMSSFDQILQSVNKSPRRFLFADPGQGVKVETLP